MLNTDSTVFVTDLIPNVNDGYPIFGKSVCEVVTQNATNVGFTSTTLNGAYTPQQYWPGGMADVVGFEYKQSSNTSYTTVYANVDSLVSYQLSGLQNGTSYDYRFFIQKMVSLTMEVIKPSPHWLVIYRPQSQNRQQRYVMVKTPLLR